MQRLDTAGSTLWEWTWRAKATPLRRRYFQRQALERRTSGIACTSVPTPNAGPQNENDSTWEQRREALKVQHRNGNGFGMTLGQARTLAAVPTPMAGSPATETYNAAGNTDYSRRIVELASTATPKASDGQGGRTTKTEGGGNSHLDTQARLASVAPPRTEDSESPGAHRGVPDTLHSQTKLSAVCTPISQDAKHSGTAPTGPGNAMKLAYEAQLASLTSPSARDWKDTSGMSETGVDPDGSTRSRLDQLLRQAQLADSGLTATGGTGATASGGQLDPEYSRWLMGLPPEWSSCADTAMRSLRPQRKRL